MSLTTVEDWLDENDRPNIIWFLKRLSANDTGANGSHQVGVYIPRTFFLKVFPDLNLPYCSNPRRSLQAYTDSDSNVQTVEAIWYNSKTRNECRITNWGGKASALQDPDSTGALAVFAFMLDDNRNTVECRVWVCRNELEEDTFEDLVGPVEPGRHGWRVWAQDLVFQQEVFDTLRRSRAPCKLQSHELPPEWLDTFPTTNELFERAVSLRPETQESADSRLMKRIQCETELFYSVESAIIRLKLEQRFEKPEDFVDLAQTILQRRKARAGRSLEKHVKYILEEEGLVENIHFCYQPYTEGGKQPDFLFPTASAYGDREFPNRNLRMLAVKRTSKDRWRQILNEANRIDVKHLLTLDNGVSERQFREMSAANVRLVIPEPLHGRYKSSIQTHLLTLESFIVDVRLLI